MRGLVNHEKRNLLAITLVYTIVICFILQYVIANDISGTADQINNFYGGSYNDYGNLFLGTLDQYYEMFIIVLMIPISFVAVIQYRESSTSKCGEFLMQLPIKRGQIFSDKDDHRNDDIYDSMAFPFIRNDHDENKGTVMV